LAQLAAIRALLIADALLDDKDFLSLAQETFDQLETDLWQKTYELYLPRPDVLTLCYTPLDVGLAVGALERLAQLSEPAKAATISRHLDSFFRRVCYGARLQLSSCGEPSRGFALVLARETCLIPVVTGVERTGSARVGDLLRYTIDMSNPTDTVWTDLVLVDELPGGVTYLVSTPPAEVDGQKLSWLITTRVEPTEERTWHVLVAVTEQAPVGERLENCAVLINENEQGELQPVRRACAQMPIDAVQPELERWGRQLICPE